ncbi:hypothetical protein BGX34_001241 [Mortierella sp. NVP85]|nr:hypothetical protein BGX34_001241 [Mortierella sp. NVP85]
MTLPQTSIKTILAYLDPHLETLQTGFPTSSRPNEPVLTKEQKQQKIEASLTNDPGIFLTKWGSVILYPRPIPSNSAADGHIDADRPSLDAEHGLTAKDILDLFAPLAEHASFEASRMQPPASSTTIRDNTHNDMDVEPSQHPSTLRSKDIAPEDRKPDPGQDDLFARSIVSEKTRRNRRLNYLLRHLAPPDSSQTSSHSSGAKGKGPGIHATSHSSSHGGGSSSNNNGSTLNPQYHPTLASILSISGSLSNLSFAESTYFSDAEMQARAPELYQQYIGRFMDNDDDEEEEDDDDDDDSADEDNVQRRRSRRSKQALEPFGKDVGLVDRILWGVDHENLKQRQQPRHSRDYNGSSMEPTLPPTRQKQQQPPSLHQHAHESLFMEHASNKQDDPSDFEEEFDTESEDEDSKMIGNREKADDGGESPKNVIESKNETHTDAIVASTASLEPAPQPILSTTASGAMLLDEPEERTRFAVIEHDNSANSDDDKELDEDTANRKEDQEALRQDFVLLMKQRFLDGLDRTFDYSIVDFDENLDDMEQENYDEEDRWFEDEDDDGTNGEASSGSRGVAHTIRSKAGLTSRMALDERLLAWENNAQNGSGDYDY